jgi:predicted AlkP superfamily pyrophosphatase or phosphodiesterase
MRHAPLILICILLGFAAGSSQNENPNRKSKNTPRLAVVIVVDQMRADHLTRFAGVYRHGLARFYRDGAVFTDAHHEHAFTSTSPGHATLSTGCFPSHHGIVNNDWFDRSLNQEMYSVQDDSTPLLGYTPYKAKNGRSPRNLLRSTLGDWMKSSNPASKVFGVARKDRAVILSVGHKADGAFWYNSDDGHLITSTYYSKTYPEWVTEFNQSGYVNRYADSIWTRLLPEEAYFLSREDSFPTEADGKHTQMPYRFAGSKDKLDKAYFSYLEDTPFIEGLIFQFAKLLVEKENMGQDEVPDLLFVGCSAADAVGHRYGPLSEEDMDYYLRLDRDLGKFFDYLDQHVGKDNYIVALSSDHGVLPLPEELARRGFPSKRYSRKELREKIARAFGSISKDHGVTRSFRKEIDDGIFLDYELARKNGISPEKLDSIVVSYLQNIDPIEGAYAARELQQNDVDKRPYIYRYRHSFYKERSPDIFLRLKPYYLLSSGFGTSHGSPYGYDTHVPLVFMGPGIQQGRHGEKVRTVDLAPTLAEILGISPESEIDGQSLVSAITN